MVACCFICSMGKVLLSAMACVCCFFTGFAQEQMNKDSLLRLLPSAKEDSSKVLLLINIGQQYEFNDYDRAKQYYLQAGQLSDRIGYKMGKIKFIANYTYILNAEGKFDSSLALNKQSIQLSKEVKDMAYIGKSYANTGNVFQRMSMYDSALVYYEKAKQYFEKIGDRNLLARMADLMQLVYFSVKNFDKAIQLGEEAVRHLRTMDNPASFAQALSNLGNSYAGKEKYDKALNLYREALTISRQLEYIELEQTALLNIGNIYLQKEVYDSMPPIFGRVLLLNEKQYIAENAAIATRAMGSYYFFTKNYAQARQYYDKALAICNEHEFLDQKLKTMEVYSSLLFAMQDIHAGEAMLKESSVIQNSILAKEVREQVVITEKRFETEKKDAQLQLQAASIQQKNTLNYILIGSAAALLLISLLSYRNYRHKQRIQQQRINELETEKKLTATEAVLKGEEQERTRLAKDLHDGLGGMLSGIKYSLNMMKGNLIMTPDNAQAFERSMDMLDSSIKEMRRVAHNMMPEALVKFGLDTALRDFCNDINNSGALRVNYQSIGMTDVVIEQTRAITIYRIVQELINNAIKHAGAREAIVQVSKTNDNISITVEDDGKGFDTAILKGGKGIGWHNIQNRVEFLKGRLDVNSQPGKGTSVLVEL